MIELTVDIVREFLDYNPETGIFRWKFRDRKWFPSDRSWKTWNTRFSNSIAGTIGRNGYRLILIHRVSYRAHRLAWLYVHGEWPSKDLDHRNHNKDDNWIDNLREVSKSENMMNGSKHVWGSSEYRGVSWDINSSKWKACIKNYEGPMYLGLYVIEEDAARAYDRAALKYFGEHAKLNFPIDDYLKEAA